MIVADFMRFYNYSLTDTLNEYAVSFYSLVNTMYRQRATEALTLMSAFNATQELVDGYNKQQKGLHGIVQEIRVARKSKK